jgi:CubicO group peptidase (beta-lactamase class C family)
MEISRRILRHLIPVWCCLLAVALVFSPEGVRADWLKDLEADALTWMVQEGAPGMAIAIVKNDEVVYTKGFGHLSADSSSLLVDADTIFLIGSTSKAFCSAQLAVLADQKRLAWSDRVKKHLPSFKMHDPWVDRQFQVTDLLCHRSGLSMFSLTMMEVLNYPTSARVWGIRFQKPITSFRSSFAYQNCMYTTAAKLAEAITGKSWGESLSESIFRPLEMTRSVTTQTAVDKMDNVAIGHLHLKNNSLWPIPSEWFWNHIQDTSLAAGAVRTTAHDMGQWVRMHLSLGKLGARQIVSEENMRYLHAPRVLISPWEHNIESPYWGPLSYCCGGWQYWGLSPQPFLYHDGGAMGSGSAIGLVPGANIGIAVLTNIEGGDYLAGKVVCRLYELYVNGGNSLAQFERNLLAKRKMLRPGPGQALSSLTDRASDIPPESYCGVYFNPAYGKFVVSQSNGNLVITMGPQNIKAKLVPTSPTGNDFLAYLPDYPDGYEMTIPMTFNLPSSGAAKLITGPIIHDSAEVFTRISN